MVREKREMFENKINNFRSNDPFKCFFDETVSYLSNVSGLPSSLADKIQDFKKFELSRDAITSRYQILAFPYLQRSK